MTAIKRVLCDFSKESQPLKSWIAQGELELPSLPPWKDGLVLFSLVWSLMKTTVFSFAALPIA